MRAAVRCVLVMIGIVASVFVGPTGVSTATTNQPNQLSGLTIASVSPKPGEIVGVAHPFVVTFSSRVPDRAAAERALDITSAAPLTGTSVTGKFEWLDHRTVQWVPDQFWPAHSTVTLSVGGRPTNFVTGPAVIGVADISNHTFTVTIDGVQNHWK